MDRDSFYWPNSFYLKNDIFPVNKALILLNAYIALAGESILHRTLTMKITIHLEVDDRIQGPTPGRYIC